MTPSRSWPRGLHIFDDYLPRAECQSLCEEVAEEQRRRPAPSIERPQPGRALRYRVLDGERVHGALPRVVDLYRAVGAFIEERLGGRFEPIPDRRVGLNVNITPPGGEYRWHYDRNAVTAILYLNAVRGGETEVFPDHRLVLGRLYPSRAQEWLDRLWRSGPVLRRFAKLERVAPAPGRLLVMRGDRCLHSVRAVEGDADRVNVIMCFDRAGASYAQSSGLDPYLYSQERAPSLDPNYARGPGGREPPTL